MVVKAVWQRTKYLTSRCLEHVVSAIPIFATQRPVLMQPIRAWLHRYITCEDHIDTFSLASDQQVREHFWKYMQNSIHNEVRWIRPPEMVEAWSGLWNALWQVCIRPIVRVLMPLEVAARRSEISVSRNLERQFHKKSMPSEVVSSYRLTWLYAINRELQDRNEAMAVAAASSPASSHADHPASLTLAHLTPMVGMVPGHMHVDGALMSVIGKEWDKLQKQKKQEGAAEEATD
jgi:hypothetical protein